MKYRYLLVLILLLTADFFNTNIVNAQCADPVPSVLKITNDSVSITWPAVTNAIGYEYVVQLSTLPQPTTGTPTTNTIAGVGNLPYAAHTAWIRTDCGTSTLSNWASISFTIVCSKPGSINITNIGGDSADITWSQIGAITSYEYVLDQLTTNPTGAGTQITGNAYVAKGLTNGTKYFMHVRTDCGSGTFSDWSTQDFTTLFPVGINAINNSITIKSYPNPVTDNLLIQLSSPGGIISISNIAGFIVYNNVVTGKELTVNMNAFTPGIYILKYRNESGSAYSKIIKQ